MGLALSRSVLDRARHWHGGDGRPSRISRLASQDEGETLSELVRTMRQGAALPVGPPLQRGCDVAESTRAKVTEASHMTSPKPLLQLCLKKICECSQDWVDECGVARVNLDALPFELGEEIFAMMQQRRALTSYVFAALEGCMIREVVLRGKTCLPSSWLASISNFNGIRYLDVSHSSLTNEALCDLARAGHSKVRLDTLILDSCTQVQDKGIVLTVNLLGDSLRKLNVSGCCQLGDEALAYITTLWQLESLALSRCQLMSTQMLCRLGLLTNLRELDVSMNPNVTNEVLFALQPCCVQGAPFIALALERLHKQLSITEEDANLPISAYSLARSNEDDKGKENIVQNGVVRQSLKKTELQTVSRLGSRFPLSSENMDLASPLDVVYIDSERVQEGVIVEEERVHEQAQEHGVVLRERENHSLAEISEARYVERSWPSSLSHGQGNLHRLLKPLKLRRTESSGARVPFSHRVYSRAHNNRAGQGATSRYSLTSSSRKMALGVSQLHHAKLAQDQQKIALLHSLLPKCAHEDQFSSQGTGAFSYLSAVKKAGLAQLEAFNLAYTGVTDLGCSFLGRLESLRKVDLCQTRLGPRGMKSLSELPLLDHLSADRCTSLGSAASLLLTLSALCELRLRHVQLGGLRLDPSVVDLTHLRVLQLESSGADDQVVALLAIHAPGLIELNVEDCPITDRGLKHIAKLERLEVLDVGDTKITNSGLACLLSLTHLRELELCHCKLKFSSFEGIIDRLPRLERLNLDIPHVPVRDLSMLAPLKHLKHLNLFGACVRDTACVSLASAGLVALVSLEICGGHVTNVGAKHLVSLQCRRLERLNLSNNLELTNLGVRYLAGSLFSGSLRSLSLCGTGLNKRAIPVLCRLTNLEELSLRSCNLQEHEVDVLHAGLRRLSRLIT